MEVITVGELKARFSEILNQVKKGRRSSSVLENSEKRLPFSSRTASSSIGRRGSLDY